MKLLAGVNDRNGFHTWTEEEVARFEARHKVGTRERLALDICSTQACGAAMPPGLAARMSATG